jgi:hypothetical protein
MNEIKVSPELFRNEQIKLMRDDETLLPREFRNALDRILTDADASSKEYESASLPLKTLLDGSKGIFTTQATLGLLLEVEKSSILQDKRQEFQDLFIVITAIPPANREQLHLMFPQGYMKYFERFDLGRLDRDQSIANWVVCFQPIFFTIHLQYFCANGKGKPLTIFAADLHSPSERIKYFGADPGFINSNNQ